MLNESGYINDYSGLNHSKDQKIIKDKIAKLS